jgi:PAS domain S-box-containing protein
MRLECGAADASPIELEALKMVKKPTYEELEQRVKELENQNIDLKESKRLLQEREQKDDALRENERTYRELFENSTDFVFTLDLKGNFTDVNKAAEDLTGYTKNELIGMSYKDYTPENNHESILKGFKRLYNEGKPLKDFPLEVIIKDGTKKYFESCISPLRKEGEIIGFQGSSREISDRKQAEKALKEANDIINKSLSVAFTWKNQKGWPVEFVSENVERIFGYTAEEFTKGEVNYAGCVHPEDLERVAKEVAEFSNKAETTDFIHEPYRIIAKDGSEKIINDWTYIVRDNDGRITHYKGIVEDITEQKRAEKEREKLQSQLRQAQKMEAIGTLAGGIAHDFNNILSAIMGYTEIAALQFPDENKVKGSLKEVLNAGRRARDLVKQILDFSRKSEQERIPIQIGPVVKEALKLLRSSLPTTIEIREHIEGDTAIVEADPTQIHQILMNLCANASHAMSGEEGILEVAIGNVEVGSSDSALGYSDIPPGNYLRLTVSDTGKGMTPEILERIFEPYYTTKEKGEGTGLGLSVAHGIVKSYGGTVTAYSEPGKGSTFHVYFPVIQKKAEVPETDEAAPIPTGNEHILLIDDEPALTDLGKQMLEKLGYKVRTRTSSMEALKLFETKPDQFDLVITDMTMPHMTGEKLAGELMKIRSDIPVIICTGYSEYIAEEKANEIGIRAFVMKPVVMRDLANTVRKVLDNK